MHPRPDPGTLEIPTIPLRKAGKAVSARGKVGVALAAESRGVFGVVVRTTIITDVVAMAAAVAVAVAVVVAVVVVAVAIGAIAIVVIGRAIRMKIASANPLN